MSIGRGALPRLDGTGRKLFWGVRPGRLDARTIDDRLYGMSAIGGKADMTVCGSPLSRSLLGVKRTCLFAPHMSAFDPKRTSDTHSTARDRQSVAVVAPIRRIPISVRPVCPVSVAIVSIVPA